MGGGGGKIPYPKHVWSPSGGWYSQPKNWKTNTAIMATVIAGIVAMAWKTSAEREYRYRMPDPGRFFRVAIGRNRFGTLRLGGN
ncbi:hypothetical protein C7212DRAFT_332595, partial [Tuber magnatum]